MDEERKYKQRGYMDTDRESRDRRPGDRPKPSGPRPPIDVTGPRLPAPLAERGGRPLFQLFHSSAVRCGLEGQVPQVRRRLALLQAMRPFRAFYSLSMPEADSGCALR